MTTLTPEYKRAATKQAISRMTKALEKNLRDGVAAITAQIDNNPHGLTRDEVIALLEARWPKLQALGEKANELLDLAAS
jgi:hypothetical protein